MSTTPMSTTGPGFVLQDGPYRAAIRAVGASLQRLTWEDRDLVLPFGDDELRPTFRGAVLAPWPNRVGDGRWTWQGQEQQLALTEPGRGHALHGLVAWSEWSAASVDARAVTLRTTVWPQPGYPFRLDLEVSWALDGADGLTCALTARNPGTDPVPYGCSIHPYLVAPGGTIDDWTLDVPARRLLLVDERMLPTELVPTPPEHDFNGGRMIAGAQIDHAYTDVELDERGETAVTIVDGAGTGARISFGAGTPWVQVCTSDWSGPGHRAAVAVEPMTCPPNALQTGTDLVLVPAGQQTRTWWRLSAVGPR